MTTYSRTGPGIYDLQFTIYDSLGTIVSGPLTNAATGVSNGLFTVALDFGSSPFSAGAARWLNIDVRPNGGASFSSLTPRQPITAVPYAITASNLTGNLPAAQLSGTIPLVQLPAAVLTNNASGGENTGVGNQALFSNTSGTYNTAVGSGAAAHNTTGYENTGLGYWALVGNTNGNDNTAVGFTALENNTSGSRNTANGTVALYNNITGSYNTALGMEALFLSTGDANIALGYGAGSTVTNGANNIEIGSPGAGNDNATIRLGTPGTHTSTFIAGIHDATVPGGLLVCVNSSGQLGALGSLPDAQLSPNVSLLNGTNVFSGTNTFNGVVKTLGGLVIENRTSDPPNRAVGQIWLRTDL